MHVRGFKQTVRVVQGHVHWSAEGRVTHDGDARVSMRRCLKRASRARATVAA